MTSNSVHTNTAAIVALQGLNRTNNDLEVVQKKVNTGFRVNDAYDDGASFAIAQGLRSDVKAYEAVNEQLSKARGLLVVASEAARRISDTLSEIRGVLTKLADEAVVGDQRIQYNNDYTALVNEINNFIGNAEFNGTNLLNGPAASTIKVIANIDGTTFTFADQDLPTSVVTPLGGVPANAAAAQALIDPTGPGGFVTAEANLGTNMATLGAYVRTLDNQLEYNDVLLDSTDIGIGAIVDADLAKESARLQSLQVRQQLGAQTLSIANQSPQILLNFFQ